MTHIAIETGNRKFVNFEVKHGDLPQRKRLPEGIPPTTRELDSVPKDIQPAFGCLLLAWLDHGKASKSGIENLTYILSMCWAGQKEPPYFQNNWAAMHQNGFYKSRVLPMNHVRLAWQQIKMPGIVLTILALTINCWVSGGPKVPQIFLPKWIIKARWNQIPIDFLALTPSAPAWQGEFAVLHHFFGANLCQQIQDLTKISIKKKRKNNLKPRVPVFQSSLSFCIDCLFMMYWLPI